MLGGAHPLSFFHVVGNPRQRAALWTRRTIATTVARLQGTAWCGGLT
jgi:hypothetical protein